MCGVASGSGAGAMATADRRADSPCPLPVGFAKVVFPDHGGDPNVLMRGEPRFRTWRSTRPHPAPRKIADLAMPSLASIRTLKTPIQGFFSADLSGTTTSSPYKSLGFSTLAIWYPVLGVHRRPLFQRPAKSVSTSATPPPETRRARRTPPPGTCPPWARPPGRGRYPARCLDGPPGPRFRPAVFHGRFKETPRRDDMDPTGVLPVVRDGARGSGTGFQRTGGRNPGNRSAFSEGEPRGAGKSHPLSAVF